MEGASAVARFVEILCDPRGDSGTGSELRTEISDLLNGYGIVLNDDGKLVDALTGKPPTFRGVNQQISIKASKALESVERHDVSLVHGHDEEAKQTVARFLERLDMRAIILHEQPNAGRTISEKLD
ncbi:MAG TPA: TIR domain-containing protein [Ktedonobacteraceae bacterium]